ncbi:HAD family hydrolase [Streptomyces sp. GXMU-J15]|uniref:HAD family hydrolase n=1 Tax=Streptomyces fuscus TaxID=3048495 RepID=A0ABT7IUZ3_9ACTN|nr:MULTISPECIES: HAD family hydrolase [Streptomyces]MDL2075912.1 HAD family hydrolase [Streptomyces fuscus]SBT92492.1 haloacid dehalogenase superfamily, subfamily IA, variant 3 with third motif having DD or ED/haloacid dehalogenase superfamily, subfamily IA, variant 1 with third motif having Dx(3-4)D or Dx(3-4)E [Streptomyces sp. DI166]
MGRVAVFDVDGTLVDTNHLHVVTWWEAFRQAGHRVPMHAVHRAVGLGSGDLIAHLLGDDRDKDRDEELSGAHKALYGQYFDRLPALSDAGELLRRLHRDGWTVVLATSAGGAELGALRRAIDADDVIAATASADDVEQGKPAPEPVEHALELAGASAEDAVFVGDTVWDMRAGSRAGVRCVAVLCGGIARADLEKAGAEAVYDGPAHLLASIEESPFARKG